MKNYDLLSKIITYALRHEPWKYELELDENGWVIAKDLLSAIRSENGDLENLSEDDLSEMIRQSDKKRHELKNGKIRALYSHSTPNKLLKKKRSRQKFYIMVHHPKLLLLYRRQD